MKRVLITGENSYIGTNFASRASEFYSSEISVEILNMLDEKWREKNFADFDVVFHVAGIAHADSGKETEEKKARYFSVNRDLAIETAKKAKLDGVKHFIFMSSMLVYESSGEKINLETVPQQKSCYAQSKWQADEKIRELSDENFIVSIIRPPMIYGKNCKGNYPLLSKIARHSPIFPDYKNERSMCYIENFCEFICQIIIKKRGGIFFPQNSEYISTSNLVKIIAKAAGHKIFISKVFNFLVAIGLKLKISKIKKAFSTLTYDKAMSEYDFDYRIADFETSIKFIEGKN
ncbi:MAG: NAD-dependent epimerase/dehydratase family protein [Synergistaceae bacterium]|nr:NAD-dependent epimerase/dehydratase family protein [Synergistaceae bacterium]